MAEREQNEKWRLEIISALKVFCYYLTWSEKDLMLGILHPGGGQYHCLSIMDDQQVLVHLNKNASATTFHPAQHSISDFGEKAEKNPEKFAQSLYTGSLMTHTYGAVDSARASRLKMLAHMIGTLEELEGESVDLRWGFFDSASEGSYSNFETMPADFPASWGQVPPVNGIFYDWAANILQIEVDGRIVATYNQQAAELLRNSGQLLKF
jgi:hypothetical protein